MDMVIGVISDTHGKLPDSAFDVFRGDYSPSQVVERLVLDAEGELEDVPAEPGACSLILHAGDIGNANERAQWILDALAEVAPTRAVLGNCDYPGYVAGGGDVGQHLAFEECGVSFAVLHDPEHLHAAINDAGPTAPAYIKPKPRVRIHGHTHEPRLMLQGEGVLLCPGSVSRPSNKRADTAGWHKSVALVRVADPGLLLSVELVAI